MKQIRTTPSSILLTMNKRIIFGLAWAIAAFSSCHRDSLEDRAEKMAKDFTQRYCPTPVTNLQRTDSVCFDKTHRTMNYYYTLVGQADNEDVVQKSTSQLRQALKKQLKSDTQIKAFVEAGFLFRYVYRSEKTGKVLFDETINGK